MIEMIIIWSVVIAVALLIEFLTYDLITSWFAVGGLVALILALCGVDVWIQILIFFVISLVCLIGLRGFVKKFIKVETTPTNLDANIGTKAHLLKDVVDGRSDIKINDTVWTVCCDDVLPKGADVIITGMAGNKYLVRDANKAAPAQIETNKKKEKKNDKINAAGN